MNRRTRLSQVIYAAGSTDQVYSEELRNRVRRIIPLITDANEVPEADPRYMGIVKSYDVSSAFVDFDTSFRLIFVVAHAMPDAYGMFTEWDGVPAILLRTPYGSISSIRATQLRGLIEDFGGPVQTVLVHELSHLLQRFQRQQPMVSVDRKNYHTDFEYLQDYHRSPVEIDAFFMQVVEPLWYKYTMGIRSFSTMIDRALEGGYQSLDEEPLDAAHDPAQKERISRKLSRIKYLGKSPQDLLARFKKDLGTPIWFRAPQEVRRRWIRRSTQLFNHALSLESIQKSEVA